MPRVLPPSATSRHIRAAAAQPAMTFPCVRGRFTPAPSWRGASPCSPRTLLVALLRAVPPSVRAARLASGTALAVTGAPGAPRAMARAMLRRGSLTTASGQPPAPWCWPVPRLPRRPGRCPVLPLSSALAAAGVAWITAFATRRRWGASTRHRRPRRVPRLRCRRGRVGLHVWTGVGRHRGRRRGPALTAAACCRLRLPGAATGRPVRWPSWPGAGGRFVFASGLDRGVVALTALAAAAALLAGRGGRRGCPRPCASRGRAPPPGVAHVLAAMSSLFDAAGPLADWTGLRRRRRHRSGRGRDADGHPSRPLVGGLGLDHAAARGRCGHPQSRDARRRGATRAHPRPCRGRPALLVARTSLSNATDDRGGRLARELRGTIEELLQARRTVELQRDRARARGDHHDPLTGVASRRLHARAAGHRGGRSAPLRASARGDALDVDGFAEINRDYGITIGDAVLRELALRLRLRMRAADALGRVGGDRFWPSCPIPTSAAPPSSPMHCADAWSAAPSPTDAGRADVSSRSASRSCGPAWTLTADELLARPTKRWRCARAAGGNRIAFDRRHGLARLEDDAARQHVGARRRRPEGERATR